LNSLNASTGPRQGDEFLQLQGCRRARLPDEGQTPGGARVPPLAPEPAPGLAAKATIKVAGLKAGARIEVVDEGRTLTAEAGQFADDFGPLAEHVYKVKL